MNYNGQREGEHQGLSVASPGDTIYAKLFQRYTESTNGKELLGKAILRRQPASARLRFLDVGAGDGILTALIGKAFAETVAVEPNVRFAEHLQTLERCTLVSDRIEQALQLGTVSGRFDLILFSYSLTGVEDDALPAVLSELVLAKKPQGRLLACTFSDNCAWARFAYAVGERIGSPLNGGSDHYINAVRAAGRQIKLVDEIETQIWDKDLPSLVGLMSFFFVKAISAYEEAAESVMALLKQHAFHQGGRAGIRVTENVYEIL